MSDTVLVNYRFSREMADGIRAKAEADIRSMTATVEVILRKALVEEGYMVTATPKAVRRRADSASKPKPAQRSAADDDFSGDLNAYVGKYPPGQVKRGDE